MRKTCLSMFAIAVAATTGMAHAATTAPRWSLIPQPAVVQPDDSGAVTVADGDAVRIEAHGIAQANAIARRFVALVASTRGLQLDVVDTPGAHARIVFKLDPASDIKS